MQEEIGPIRSGGSSKMTAQKQQFTITKKIAKHGNQAVIVIPTVLLTRLKPQTLVKVTIDVLEEIFMEETG